MYRYFFALLFILSPTLLSAQTDAERAATLIEGGRFSEAKQITDRLLRQATTLSDADALTNIGIAFEDSGRYPEAEPFFKRALEIYEKIRGKDHPDTVPALTNLAINRKERGRYAEAEPLYQQALKIVAPNSLEATLLMNNLGFLYQEQYRYAEAEKLYEEALDNHKKRTGGKDDKHMASPLQNLARLYYFQSRSLEAESPEKQKLLREAESLAKRALKIDEEESGKDDPLTGMSLNMLGAVYSDQKRFAEAEPLLKRALANYEKGLSKNHPWHAECSHDLATLYERQKRYKEAEPLRDHTIAVYRQSGAEAHIGQDWYKSRAILYKNTNRPREAVADLKEAMRLSLEVRKHTSGGDEQRAHTFLRYYSLFEMMVDWQYELGNIHEAYKAMEQSRAQGLQDLMNAADIDLLAGVPEATAGKLQAAETAAFDEVVSCVHQLEAVQNQPDSTPGKRKDEARLTEALKIARKKLDDAKAAIRAESPAYRLMIAKDREPVALDIIRRELVMEKSLAAQYLIGAEKSYLLLYGLDMEPRLLPLTLDARQAAPFGVEAGHLTTKKLASILQNEKKDGVLQLLTDMKLDANNNPRLIHVTEDGMPTAKTLEKLAVLWTVLIPDEQIRAKITDRKTFARLLILPDGALARLPFESLVVKPDAVNPQYLLDQGPATIYAPSASMYYNLKIRKTESVKPQTLTVGRPDYKANRNVQPRDANVQRQVRHRAAIVGIPTDLKWTEEETKRIEASCKEHHIAVTRFNLAQSTEERVRQNVAGKRIVHLACHGQAKGEASAFFSSLLLTIGNPNSSKDDGYLELAEMFALSLKACELAVLSACVTNLGPNQPGEGTWSLGRGMLASGAKRVVTTNWLVDDEASALLVYFFIDRINESISESSEPDHAAALRQARREIRDDREHPKWRHPYFWAPFVLIGPN